MSVHLFIIIPTLISCLGDWHDLIQCAILNIYTQINMSIAGYHIQFTFLYEHFAHNPSVPGSFTILSLSIASESEALCCRVQYKTCISSPGGTKMLD